MLKNYIKIALRSLAKNKAFTLINTFGLFIGLTAFLLIYAYVDFEQGYDSYHQDADRIYRVVTWNVADESAPIKDAMSFSPMGEVMLNEMAGVEQYTTTMKLFESLIFKKDDELINETGVLAADEGFFDLFSYPLLEAENNPLRDPHSLILTRNAARRLFGQEDVVGKTIEVKGIHAGNYKVTGLIDDLPRNTHYKFEIIISYKTIEGRAREDGWRGYTFYTYVKLKEGVTQAQIESQLPAIKEKYLPPTLTLAFHIQPLTDIHLEANYTYEPEPSGNARTVGFLLVIAVFILLIAWVNYINLSTAKAMDRAKEVGLRKVVGAGRGQLIFQFLLESLFINISAAILALTAVQLLGPMYNRLLEKDLIQNIWQSTELIELLLTVAIVGSLLSGFYPAFVLSSFKPITALKGKLRNSTGGIMLRKGLVVFQFIASLILIAGTAIVYLQIDYMKNRDLGIDIDNTIAFRLPPYDSIDAQVNQQKYELLRAELNRIPTVSGVASASSIPGGGRNNIAGSSGGLSIVGKTPVNSSNYYSMMTDPDFFPTMNVPLIAGRNFMKDTPSRWRYAVVNEALLRHLGYTGSPEEAIGEKLRFGKENSNRFKTIIGVVSDFNRRSLKDEIEPTVFHHGYDYFTSHVVMRLAQENVANTLERAQAEWSAIFPDTPFDYNFMDEQFDAAYKEDQQFGSIFGAFSMLAMSIAGLGLFGLSSFIAVQRSKEIGVRKVLGASVMNIMKLIAKDFFTLVMIAFLLGSPLVYFIMDGWLNNYAFRIDLPLWLLPFAGLLLLFITICTVGYQTARAARANPVDTLRAE